MSSQQTDNNIDSNSKEVVEILDTDVWSLETFPPSTCCSIQALINGTKYSFDSIERFEEAIQGMILSEKSQKVYEEFKLIYNEAENEREYYTSIANNDNDDDDNW